MATVEQVKNLLKEELAPLYSKLENMMTIFNELKKMWNLYRTSKMIYYLKFRLRTQSHYNREQISRMSTQTYLQSKKIFRP